jgi:hypothetical protein
MKSWLNLSSNGWLVLASTIVYISVLTIIFEYVISREFPMFLQMISVFFGLFYTVSQLKIISKYVINLFNFKEKEEEV